MQDTECDAETGKKIPTEALSPPLHHARSGGNRRAGLAKSSKELGRMFVKILIVLGVVELGLCLFFYLFQRSFLYRPTPLTAEHRDALVLEVPDAAIRISAHVRRTPKALLFFGGNAEDVAVTVPKLAELFPDRAVYAMHYRGYSGSSGRPSEAALRSDAEAVFAMVEERHPDVMLVGRSLGSSLAVGLAGDAAVSRLVLIAPFASILRIAQRTAPFLPMRLLLTDRYESWRYAPRVTCPTLLLAASHDELVPMADTERLWQAFRPGVARLRVMEGTDHNTVASVPEFYEALLRGE